MSKKIIAMLILVIALVGILSVGILGANAVTDGDVLATALYFEGEGLEEITTSNGTFKKMEIPKFDNNGEAVINLANYIVLVGDAENNIPPTRDINTLSKSLVVSEANKDKVSLTGFLLVFTDRVNVKVVIKTTDGSNKTAILYVRNDALGDEPIIVPDL
jgi:hypothetical protein